MAAKNELNVWDYLGCIDLNDLVRLAKRAKRKKRSDAGLKRGEPRPPKEKKGNGKRGRPALYTKEDREHFAELLRTHGLTGAMRRCMASQTVLSSVAKEFGISFQKGKRAVAS